MFGRTQAGKLASGRRRLRQPVFGSNPKALDDESRPSLPGESQSTSQIRNAKGRPVLSVPLSADENPAMKQLRNSPAPSVAPRGPSAACLLHTRAAQSAAVQVTPRVCAGRNRG